MDSQGSKVDLVWETAKSVGVAMMATHGGDEWHVRPMMGMPDQASHAIWFIADADSAKVFEARQDARSVLAYADTQDRRYLSIYGQAKVTRDEGKVRELWNPWAEAFFPNGPSDPDVVLLKFVPEHAEYWTGPARRDMTRVDVGTAADARRVLESADHGKVEM